MNCTKTRGGTTSLQSRKISKLKHTFQCSTLARYNDKFAANLKRTTKFYTPTNGILLTGKLTLYPSDAKSFNILPPKLSLMWMTMEAETLLVSHVVESFTQLNCRARATCERNRRISILIMYIHVFSGIWVNVVVVLVEVVVVNETKYLGYLLDGLDRS